MYLLVILYDFAKIFTNKYIGIVNINMAPVLLSLFVFQQILIAFNTQIESIRKLKS